MKTNKLVIIGDSAFAEIAFEYFSADSEYEVVGFAVEKEFLTRKTLFGLPVVAFEDIEKQYNPTKHFAHVAVVYTKMNRVRQRLIAATKAKGYMLASYVSSRAFIWRNVEIGEHCFIFEDNTVQPFVKIGHNVVLWSGNHIGHHSIVGNNCFISSHVVVSGFCDIGENSFIGVNATVANNLKIGTDNWIGPNTTIMKSTHEGAFYRTRQPASEELSSIDFFKIVSK